MHIVGGIAAIAAIGGACAEPQPVPDLVAEARDLDLAGRQPEAIALYEQVLARDPDSYDAHYGLGRALDLDGQYARAREHFQRAIELAPEASTEQTLRMMGIAWTFVGDAPRAAPYFEQVYERRTAAGLLAGAGEVANELGRVYLELGDPDSAEMWYRRGYETALRVEPLAPWQSDLAEFRWAHAQARIEARRGNTPAAREAMARARERLDRGTNPDQQVQYPYLAGYVAFYLGDSREAVAELEQADQDDPFVLWLLARAHETLGEPDAAATLYARVLASNSHAVTNAIARPAARGATGANP